MRCRCCLSFVRLAVALVLSASIVACRSAEPPAATVSVPPPPLPPPTFSALSVGARAEWWRGFPEQTPRVAVAERAWAVLPQPGSALAEVAIVRVDAVGATTVAVIDRMQQRVDALPASAVHPIGKTQSLKEGTLALVYTPTTPGYVAVVSHAREGQELRVKYDWAGTTRETDVEHAEALRREVEPLAWVVYPKAMGNGLGQVVAADRDRVWILDGSGTVTPVARASVVAAGLSGRALSVGERIGAHRFSFGVEAGTVARILEPGLRYEVAFSGNRPTASLFVTSLVPP